MNGLKLSTSNDIERLISSEDWNGLEIRLNCMSNMEFRRIQVAIRESILPKLDNKKYWRALLQLIKFRKQSFITGILAIDKLAERNILDFKDKGARALSEYLNSESPETVKKIADMAISKLNSIELLEEFFEVFKVNDLQKLPPLLKCQKPQTYYCLFKALQRLSDNNVVRLCCNQLVKHNSDISFNMASILKSYFDISDLKWQLSLKIEPYELNRIDRDYNTFCSILNGKRPII